MVKMGEMRDAVVLLRASADLRPQVEVKANMECKGCEKLFFGRVSSIFPRNDLFIFRIPFYPVFTSLMSFELVRESG